LKKIILFLLFLQFFSCNYFEKPTISTDSIVEKRLKEINWNTVDTYPTVSGCEILKDKTEQKKCFFDYMTQTISEKLNPIVSKNNFKTDSIQIKVTVLQDATLQFESIKDSLNANKNKIDSLLNVRLIDFSKIIPATKRGIQVKTQFIIQTKIALE
jgi:hypothetical protein